MNARRRSIPERVTVAVAGDWDSTIDWARRCIETVAGQGIHTLLHLGDFGLSPSPAGQAFLAAVDEACLEHDVTIYVTPGNHENWPAILTAPVAERNEIGLVAWFGERIAVLPRGHRFTLGDSTFVSLGGAPSIDYEFRVSGVDWWPEEMITQDDVAAVVAGGHAEIMLAHDAPDAPWQTDKVAAVCANNPGGWPAKVRAYATSGRRRLTEAFLAVEPELYLHGHYHLADRKHLKLPSRGRSCNMVALDCEWTPGNLQFLDLTTLSLTSH
jgi:hypothetical protein